MKKLTLSLWAILLLSLLGWQNANAQFLENTDKVDIVSIRGFDGDGVGNWYLADIGVDTDSLVWSQAATDVIKWYRIPAGGVSDGTADVQAYYYKNVASGRYLYLTGDQLAELAGDDGDWPTKRAYATAQNAKTANFKWFERNTNGDWGWASNLHNAAAYYPEKRDGNKYNILSGIIMQKIKDGGINGEEFFGVYEPNASVGGHAGGLGNVWYATKIDVVAANVENPDIPHFLANTEKADIITIRGFDGDGVGNWYLADIGVDTDSLVWSQETTGVIKWYRIPAGSASDGTADVQAYYYKNVASGRYLYITDGQLTELAGDDGDWPSKRAYATSTYGTTANYKWFERNTNAAWGWASNLHNAAAYYPEKRDGNHYNILSGILMEKIKDGGINGEEFFGVYEPNASVGGYAGGLGNVWYATKIDVAGANAANPDYRPDNSPSADIITIRGFDGDGVGLWYLADIGVDTDSLVWSQEATDVIKWYRIPAGAAFDNVQAYYYKNVETGRYLYITSEQLAELAGDDGDWPIKRAYATSENAKTDNFRWFERNTNAEWGWASNLHSAAAYYPEKRDGNHYNILSGIVMQKIKDGGIDGEEFFGVYEPNASVGGYAGGLGNAWHATKIDVTATGANPDYVSDGLAYSIEELNFFATDDGENADAASYAVDTHTITYKNGGWHRAGWNWEAEGGIDVAGYNQVWIKFDASALPKTGDGEGGATKLQFDVVYTDDSNAQSETGKNNEFFANNTEYFYNLTPGKKIKRITLKSQAEGDVVLTGAYFFTKGIDKVDLIVTDITWTPVNPVLGDSILFSATIKNISEFASPNVKHGVSFAIKGSTGNNIVVAFSDTHLTSLAPGEEVTLTANGNPNGKTDGGKWIPGLARTYTVVAQVNDQNDIPETDIANNFLEKEIIIATSGINAMASEGQIYTSKGKIYFENFPENTVVSIYNLQAQKIGDYKASEVSNQTFPTNLYIVKVQSGNISSNCKILVK
ncbi:hypothetical protein FACS189413_04850 [Bacteroidia bacterium]|nr:hypothetical protein FACS189413_04850 [Bacteroidia bacterium]